MSTAEQQQGAASGAVVEKKSPKKTFQELVDSDQFKNQILMALPKHLTPDRFIRVLQTAVIKTPKLLECTQESMFRCIFDSAAVGLEIDGRRAALVPLRNNKKEGRPLEANLWLMYQGIAELVMRSGVASNIHADIVCENDAFEYDRGELKAHKIDFKKDRGDPYAVYCIIRMKDGSEKVEVMSMAEVDRIRAASPGANGDAWSGHFTEMAKKTVFKRAAKWVPLSAEIKNVLESEHEEEPVNITPKATLASLIGAAADSTPTPLAQEPAAEPADKPNPDLEPSTPTNPPAEKTPVATPPAAAPKTYTAYTAEQRETFLREVENLMIDNAVTESAVLIYAHKHKLAKKEQDAVSSLDTGVLDEIRTVIPTLKKKP